MRIHSIGEIEYEFIKEYQMTYREAEKRKNAQITFPKSSYQQSHNIGQLPPFSIWTLNTVYYS